MAGSDSKSVAAPSRDRILGVKITPMTRRRLANFRANTRAYWSTWIFIALVATSMLAPVLANDKPLVIVFDGGIYLPIWNAYPETRFGGEFATEADYRDPYVQELIDEKGWMVWPPVPFSYNTINYDLRQPAPSPPDSVNWLGTDDQGRDVVARVIYGFRISVLFGVTLTVISSIIGIASGAAQGYFGGVLDLVFQRFLEIWSSIPLIYLLIIMAAVITPGFWTLLILMLLFSWMSLVGVVRAEFLRARNFDYVRAAKALGQPDRVIMFKHVLPNAMVATVTYMPFILVASLTTLTALDFLGLGLPPGSPSLGELVKQAKTNIQAPWLAFTSFMSIFMMLALVVFIGEGVRDAFDPRKAFGPVSRKDTGPAAQAVRQAETRAAAE